MINFHGPIGHVTSQAAFKAFNDQLKDEELVTQPQEIKLDRVAKSFDL